MKFIFLGFFLSSTTVFASDFNHLRCDVQLPSQAAKKQCYVDRGAVQFADDQANSSYAQDMTFTVLVNFACPGNAYTDIVVSAGLGNPSSKLRFGETTLILNGTGPVYIEDFNAALTLHRTFDATCSLTFKLLDAQPTAGQLNVWLSKAQLQASELHDLVEIYQTRTVIMFWNKKLGSGDTSLIPIIKGLRDDLEKQVKDAPSNFILKSRLKKYDELLDHVPSDVLEQSYQNILEEISASIDRAGLLIASLNQYEISTPETLKAELSRADGLLKQSQTP